MEDHPLAPGHLWLAGGPHYGVNTWRDIGKSSAGLTDGTLANAPAWSGQSPVGGRGSLAFNGSSTYVVPANLPAVGTGDFTFVARSVQSDTTTRILFGTNATLGNNFWFSQRIISVNGTSVDGGAFTAGRWYQSAATRQNGSCSFYRDGLLLAGPTTDANLAGSVTTGGHAIGRFGLTAAFYFAGLIESLMFFPSVGLSGSAIQSLNEETLRGYPTLLRRLRGTAFSFATAAPAGNRRRRVIICGSR